MNMKGWAVAFACAAGAAIGARAGMAPVPYLSPKFDSAGRLTDFTSECCTDYTLLLAPSYNASPVVLKTGWYVVSNAYGAVVMQNGMAVDGDVHLIVCDGQELVSTNVTAGCPGIKVMAKGSLTIYAQSTDEAVMGKVTAASGKSFAGIQGDAYSSITVNGGAIYATGGDYGAGIGGGQRQDGENITINGGVVHATGGDYGAGIGGGEYGVGADITVNGGRIWARGGVDGAGIGGGAYGAGKCISIDGGTVDASSGGGGAERIGGGAKETSGGIVFTGGCIVGFANPNPTDAKGNPVYWVVLPDGVSAKAPDGFFTGACTLWFGKGLGDEFGYGTRDIYSIDAGHLFLYLPNGDYEISVLDESRAVKRYKVSVAGGIVKVERIYDYITFESQDTKGDGCFSLKTENEAKNWDAELFYSHDLVKWAKWDGSEVVAYRKLYVRGTANTVLCWDANERWVLEPEDGTSLISCRGNLETLRGAAGKSPAVAPMDRFCYSYLFYKNSALASAPALTATTLSGGCYAYMFCGCTSLREPPALPATALETYCYASMFEGCDNICLNAYRVGKTWRIPKDAIPALAWNANMFLNSGACFWDASEPEIGMEYYLTFVTLVNPASPPRYRSKAEATNGVATSFVVWPNQDVAAAQPNRWAYNAYFTVTDAYDTASAKHVLRVDFTEATSNAVQASIQAAMPALVETVTNAVPFTTVHAVPGIYYGIAGSTNLLEVAHAPNVPAGQWTVGLGDPLGTRVEGAQPACATNQAFFRMKATIVP